MKKIYLHMGSHKTGTTSIQSTLFNFKEELKEKNFEYFGGKKAHPNLYSAFKSDPMEFPWNRLSGLSKEDIIQRDQKSLKNIERKIKASECETLLFSSEFLSMLNPSEMQNLKGFFDQFGDVHAVYFYRELQSWISSDSQQLSKVGFATRPTTFEVGIMRIFDFPMQIHNVFGADRTHFLKFEEMIAPQLTLNLLKQIGVDIGPEIDWQEIRENEAISGNAVHALFIYNRLFPLKSPHRNKKNVERLKNLPGEKYVSPRLTPAQINVYEEKRQEVKKALGLRLSKISSESEKTEGEILIPEILKMINQFIRKNGL
ncbi:MAG: hypothetical protein AAF429_00940 [Pseudomonadota bacterium]